MKVFLSVCFLLFGLAGPVRSDSTPAVTPESVNSDAPAPTVVTETRLVLNLKQRRLYVYRADRAIASYPVAIGRRGWETPTGRFAVIQMTRDPVWQHPFTGQVFPAGKNNPLGARWIGFWTDGENSIGFHGTPDERLIGRAVSHGCVRMRNRDIKALFEKVSVGTTVTVIAR
jgi:lipoprotein-anchoring transpeptidase ErfK/SrfK